MRVLHCNITNCGNTFVLISLIQILLLLILQCSVVSTGGRNSRRVSHFSRNKDDRENTNVQDDLWDAEQLDLFGLLEEDVNLNLKEDDEVNHLKRRIRSPFDEDIDEAKDSDEDDQEDDETSSENKAKMSSKKSNISTKLTTSTVPTAQVVSPHHIKLEITTHASNSETANNKTSNHQIDTTISIDKSKVFQSNNGTGRRALLPPGFQSIPPKTVTINMTSSAGVPPHGRRPTGLVSPRGKHPIPPGPHISGKLPFPPHLLKQLSAQKPPPKKGELYLPEDYNNLVIPKLNLGRLIGIDAYSAVPVLVFLNIRSVRDIDESLETLTLDLDLVIEWVDGFLFDPISAITARQADITLNPIFLKKIWRPDIYIDEIVKVKRTSLMSKPLKLKFNPSNGFISYTTRLTVQLSCDMIYTYYPADTHRCEFTFRSYSYFSKDMQLSWLGAGVYLQDPYDPNFDLQVESTDRLKLAQTFRKLTNDTFDGLQFTLLARRKLSFHMVQTYLPSVFFIVITWLCFLVPSRMVEARIGISMTTLLTLTSMFASVRESTPIVSYVKAIDIWMVFCIFFVFLTLLEFATFVWLRARREDAEEQKLERQRMIQEKRGNRKKDVDFEASLTRRHSSESVQLRKYERFAEFIEKFAFVIFSAVFLLFNIVYWTWLLTASNYFDWSVNSTLNDALD